MAYTGTRITTEFTYQGAEVRWIDTSAADLEKFLPIIDDYADLLSRDYKVVFHRGDSADLRLDIDFKGAAESTGTMRRRLKSDVFGLISATLWGGSG